MNPRAQALAGWLLLLAVIGIGLHTLLPDVPRLWAALACWGAGILLWPSLKSQAQKQSIVLLLIGSGGIAWGLAHQVGPNLHIATSANAMLLAMLASVSFLRLITRPASDDQHKLAQGRRALWHSLFAVHFFGSVINLSSVFIVGDHLSRKNPLSDAQVRVLTRAFASAAYWSPFFAAMAAALTYSPGASLPVLWIGGIPLALLSLAITALACRQPQQFVGYPMHLGALWLPITLAVSVLLLHQAMPDVPVLGIICLLAPLITVLTLWLRREAPLQKLRDHVRQDMPGMKNELVLFLAAGVMASGLNSVFQTFGGWLPFDQFGALEAVMVLWFMLITSLIGVHPVINIATIGTLLAPLHPDASLLAMTFLCGWAIGVVNSPYSGMSLAMQGRYNIPPLGLTRLNGAFSLIMALGASLMLAALDTLVLN